MSEVNMSSPAITVIINMYKGETTVSRMIDCVLNQTFKDFELILVDDGSPDRCGEIAEEYAKRDERVRVLHKPNGGLADARNHALEIAKGEYTIQFDQDDWLELKCLEEMYAKAKEDNADMVICDYYHNDEYSQTYGKQTPTALDHWSILKDVLTGNLYGYCWNKLIKLDVYRKFNVQFPIEFYGCEDQYGMCQMLKHNIKIAYLPKAYCHYVYVTGSLSRYYDEESYKNDIIVREMFTELLADTPYKELAYEQKSLNLVHRAFHLGNKVFTAQSFKTEFERYKPLIKKLNGINKYFLLLSIKGYYPLAKTTFNTLFQIKQYLKKLYSKISKVC